MKKQKPSSYHLKRSISPMLPYEPLNFRRRDEKKKDMTTEIIEGASFSDCRKYRWALWRIWDNDLPLIAFVGLNPSTANESTNDATIRRVISIGKSLGYGGIYMLNCFPYISTDPNQLNNCEHIEVNDVSLQLYGNGCKEVVFAWGAFKIVKEKGRDKDLIKMFPNAKCLHINKDGSPKHPLYCRTESQLIPYQLS